MPNKIWIHPNVLLPYSVDTSETGFSNMQPPGGVLLQAQAANPAGSILAVNTPDRDWETRLDGSRFC